MDTQNNQPCRKRNGKETSFEFKIFVIQQIANGQISANFASKKYNISRSTIAYWQKKLSNYMTEKNGFILSITQQYDPYEKAVVERVNGNLMGNLV